MGFRRHIVNVVAAVVFTIAATGVCFGKAKERRLLFSDYRDKVQAAWIGKMAGVSLGIATEFRYSHHIVPDSMMPRWSPEKINEGFNQDDIYLQYIALQTLENRGLDVSSRQACLDRINYQTEYGGRNHVVYEKGIAPPDLGHPDFKQTADGCGYTCSSDFSGIIAPGLSSTPVRIANQIGTSIGYGDGLLAGIFVGAMYSEAFFTKDIQKIIETALLSIPSSSLTSQAVRDVMAWSKQYPDWKITWGKVMDKYWWNVENNWISWPYGGGNKGINLDSKSMAAFSVMALLYGKGNLTNTINIAVQASEDADCDASIAAGILCVSKGLSFIDATYYSAMRSDAKFKYLSGTFSDLMSLTESVARKNISNFGGRIENVAGKEYIVVPAEVQDRRKEKYISSKNPEPAVGSRFTADEMDQLNLVVDPGFENQSAAWSFFSSNNSNHTMPLSIAYGLERFDNAKARTGFNNVMLRAYFKNQYLKAAQTPVFVGFKQQVKVKPMRRYSVSCYVRCEGGDMRGRGILSVKNMEQETVAEVKYGGKTEWTKVALEFESGKEESVEIVAGFNPESGVESIFRYDDFLLLPVKSNK